MQDSITTKLLNDLARDPLLVEREATHGPFSQNAVTWDRIMTAIDWEKFDTPELRLCATMIALKLARACTNPRIADHWDDIAGYAKLATEK